MHILRVCTVVCIYVHMRACTHVRMYLCMYVCMYCSMPWGSKSGRTGFYRTVTGYGILATSVP